MHIVQVVTCPSNLKNGQSNITLVDYHGQPKLTSNIVHCCMFLQQSHYTYYCHRLVHQMVIIVIMDLRVQGL